MGHQAGEEEAHQAASARRSHRPGVGDFPDGEGRNDTTCIDHDLARPPFRDRRLPVDPTRSQTARAPRPDPHATADARAPLRMTRTPPAPAPLTAPAPDPAVARSPDRPLLRLVSGRATEAARPRAAVIPSSAGTTTTTALPAGTG